MTGTFNIVTQWQDAHNTDYASIEANGQFNINVLFFPVKKTSLVNGTAQTATGTR
jgi:hypothetical protein